MHTHPTLMTTPTDAAIDTATDTATETPAGTSRRRLLRLAAAGAAGAAAAAITSQATAAADAGVIFAAAPTSTTSRVGSAYIGNQPGAGFLFQSNPGAGLGILNQFSPYPAALVGLSNTASTSNGVLGHTNTNGGTGVIGHSEHSGGMYGVQGVSNGYAGVSGESKGFGPGVVGTGWNSYGVQGVAPKAAGLRGSGRYGVDLDGAYATLRLGTSGGGPTTRTVEGRQGDIYLDETLDLWLCVATGTPGTWRRLGGLNTAGAFTAITPTRVYDSRVGAPNPGLLTRGGNRTISVADGRDLDTGTVTVPNVVPAGATAITCNVTVVGTVDAGFVTANPGGVTTVSAASVNWFGPGQIINNGIVARLGGDRQLTLVAGGGDTHVVVDVTGYWR